MLHKALPYMLVILLHGSAAWWTRAEAQGFNHRYDPIVPGNAQFAWGVEQKASGELVVFNNQPWIDPPNFYYNSRMGSLVLSPAGVLLHETLMNSPYRDAFPGWCNPTVRLPDGRFAGGGGTTDTTGKDRVLLYKFDQDGEPLSYTEIQPTNDHWIGYQLKNTPDGGFIFTGVTDATGVQDIFLLKTDSLGNVQWWRTYGHPTRLDYATSVDLMPDGGYCTGGEYPLTLNNVVQWVARTDSLGNMLWQQPRGLPVESSFNAAVLTASDGNIIYAAGKFSGGNDQQHWPNLVKLDPAGNVLWDKTYGDAVFGTGFFSVAEVPATGDLIACGQKWYQTDNGFPYRKGILVRANSDGDSLWMREYFYYDSLMSDCQAEFRDVQPTPDGGFVAVGAAYGSISGNNPPGLSQDVWVVKVDSLGCIIPGCDDFSTVITVQATNLGSALSVYPNPARASTTVKVTLPAGSPFVGDLHVRLVSSDGKEVLVQKAAIGENQLSLHELAGGIYYLHLTSGTTWLSGTKLLVE